MSPETLRLYLSLAPENTQKVNAKICELLSAEEIQFLGMANDPDHRTQFLTRLDQLNLLPSFLAAEGGGERYEQ